MNSLARTDTGLVIPKGSNSLHASFKTSRLVMNSLFSVLADLKVKDKWSESGVPL